MSTNSDRSTSSRITSGSSQDSGISRNLSLNASSTRTGDISSVHATTNAPPFPNDSLYSVDMNLDLNFKERLLRNLQEGQRYNMNATCASVNSDLSLKAATKPNRTWTTEKPRRSDTVALSELNSPLGEVKADGTSLCESAFERSDLENVIGNNFTFRSPHEHYRNENMSGYFRKRSEDLSRPNIFGESDRSRDALDDLNKSLTACEERVKRKLEKKMQKRLSKSSDSVSSGMTVATDNFVPGYNSTHVNILPDIQEQSELEDETASAMVAPKKKSTCKTRLSDYGISININDESGITINIRPAKSDDQ